MTDETRVELPPVSSGWLSAWVLELALPLLVAKSGLPGVDVQCGELHVTAFWKGTS